MLASPPRRESGCGTAPQTGIDERESGMAFIGSLQSRKAKSVVNSVSYIHSLDRLSLAKEIENGLKVLYDALCRSIPLLSLLNMA